MIYHRRLSSCRFMTLHIVGTLYHSISFLDYYMSGKWNWLLGICKKGEMDMEEYGDRNLGTLFTELSDYEKKGVYMLINGIPASPMQIVRAHIVREESAYMRDYVLNENGDLKELDFQEVEDNY